MKKILILLIGLVLTAQVWAGVGTQFKYEDLWYKITSDNAPYTVEIIKERDDDFQYAFDYVDIPEFVVYNGQKYTVTGIGSEVFRANTDNTFNSDLVSIHIPSTVTYIADNAFWGCTSLEHITLPEGLTSIGESAFGSCSKLSSISIPNNVTSIGSCAFSESKLSSVFIPKSVTNISGVDVFRLGSPRHFYYGNIYFETTTLPNGLNGETLTNSYETVVYGVKYIRTVANNGLYGTFTATSSTSDIYICTDGTVCFKNNVTVTIKAIPAEGCQFVKWSDGVTTAERTITASSSMTLTAEFKIQSFEVDGFNYGIDKSGTSVTINTVVKNYRRHQIIPSSVKYGGIIYSVNNIAKTAFSNCKDLETVVFAEDSPIKNIGTWFAYLENLRFVSLPLNVETIAAGAFEGCKSLTSFPLIPEGSTTLKTIGEQAFKGCGFTGQIQVPNTVETIGDYAFASCKQMQGCLFGTNVKTFGKYVLYNCENLETVSLNSPETIGQGFCMSCSKLTTFMHSSKIFGDLMFNGCTALNNISLENVTSVGKSVFKGCTGITQITIPNSITSMGENVFDGCTNLKTVNLRSTHIGNCLNNLGITTVNVEDITEIPANAFTGCNKIASITIPEEITVIGSGAFKDCSELASVYYGNEVIEIASSAFENCTSLTSIFMPDKIATIGDGAYKGCTGIKKVTLPSSITSMGENVFEGCTNLTQVTIKTPNIGKSLNNLDITSVTIGNGMKEIPSDAFFNCQKLSSVSIPNTVTTIGSSAFKDCVSLSSVKLPNNVTSIGKSAFSGCTSLNTINIPDGVTQITSNTFYGCSGLNSITIPADVTAIGEGAFNGCSGLSILAIPDKVTTIGSWAFAYTSIKSINIPDGVTEIQPYTFSQCRSLTSVNLPNQITSIGESAFAFCTGVKTVVIPASVTTIQTMAFKNIASDAIIYCEVAEKDKPSGWNANWNASNCTVKWGQALSSGALTLTYSENDITAEIKGDFATSDNLPLQINQSIDVSNVTVKRQFTANIPSTIMLPFDFTPANSLGKFYTVASVAPDAQGVWTATMSQPITGKLQANIPYVFKPANDITELTFDNVTLRPTTAGANGSGEWQLHGVYSKTALDATGKINYGFAGVDAEGIQKGQFIRAGEGVWADPMRCYLTYHGNDNRLTKASTVLPDNIRVVFPDEIEESNNGEIITPTSEINNEPGVKVWSYNRTIYIESQPDIDYTIIDLNGRILKTGVTHSTREEVVLSRYTGIVIVNVNGKSFKISY